MGYRGTRPRWLSSFGMYVLLTLSVQVSAGKSGDKVAPDRRTLVALEIRYKPRIVDFLSFDPYTGRVLA